VAKQLRQLTCPLLSYPLFRFFDTPVGPVEVRPFFEMAYIVADTVDTQVSAFTVPPPLCDNVRLFLLQGLLFLLRSIWSHAHFRVTVPHPRSSGVFLSKVFLLWSPSGRGPVVPLFPPSHPSLVITTPLLFYHAAQLWLTSLVSFPQTSPPQSLIAVLFDPFPVSIFPVSNPLLPSLIVSYNVSPLVLIISISLPARLFNSLGSDRSALPPFPIVSELFSVRRFFTRSPFPPPRAPLV